MLGIVVGGALIGCVVWVVVYLVFMKLFGLLD